jgi:ribonuclease Z
MPLPDRWLTALLLRYNGKLILIDCGEGAQIPVKLAGWGFKSIEAICFTHYHADHVAGLPGLLLTIGNSGRTEPLAILGPPGLTKIIKGITVIAPELPYEIKLTELADENITINNLSGIIIKSIPVEHTVPCLSYCVEIRRAGKFDVARAQSLFIPQQFWSHLQKGEVIRHQGSVYTPEMVLGEERKGLKVSYCTDTRPTEALPQFINKSDLFICEGMYGEEEKLPKAVENKHMIFSEAAHLARKGCVNELWLTHYSPALEKPEFFLDNGKRIFNNTNLGRDLMKKSLLWEL